MTTSIVVGVDGSSASRTALRWAIEEARLRNAKVVAVHAWWGIPDLEPGATVSDADWETIRAEEGLARVEEFVDETLRGARRDVEIVCLATQGVTVVEALVEAAGDADLLVVGSRGLGRFRGMLGSVSRGCVEHAICPVVVIRGEAARGARRLEGVA